MAKRRSPASARSMKSASTRPVGRSKATLLSRPQAAAAIIVGDIKSLADARIFIGASSLVAYVHGHVDTARVDITAASENGILVTRASPGFAPAVAELVIGFMIDLTRGITRSTLMWRTGGSPETALSSQLSSRILGIIGYGNIGRHLAMLARAMGMRVLVNDPYVQVDPEAGVEQVSFDDLLKTADIVVPLVAATPSTTNLIDAAALARMKPSAFLINVSRGEVVDEAALEQALDRRVIAGAALDVGLDAFRMPAPRLATPRRCPGHAAYRWRHAGSNSPPGAGDGSPGRGDPRRRNTARRDQSRSRDSSSLASVSGPQILAPPSSMVAPTDLPASTI